MLKIIGIGDNVCDIYINRNKMYPGGQALNFSVYAKKLGFDSAYMGVFGKDEVSEHVISILNSMKIDYSHSRHYHGENGYAVVRIDDGDRVFVKSNKGGISKDKPIILEDLDKEYIKKFDLVHTSNNSYFNSQLKYVYDLGVTLSYDFSNKWSQWEITEEISKYIDYGFISCSLEDENSVKEICKKIHDMGCKVVIATMGSNGAVLYNGTIFIKQFPKTVNAIDTLGAGDSFAVGFLTKLLNENKIYEEALEYAAEFAAENCLVEGAFGYGVDIPETIFEKIK
jgi:sugar/nucleoside kinase (ribokinase family)